MIFQNCCTQFHEPLGEWNLPQFWNITSGIYAKYHVQIMLLFVYTTTRKRFVIFTCRYFKLSWNTTTLLDLAYCQVYWRRQVWPAEILLWKSNIRCYDQLCFGLWFGLFFGSIGFNFFYVWGFTARFAGEDALLNRRKSGKYKKYLCKLENTENSIFFSVKPNFKSDIQNIFNCLLHFYARQMDQRLGFSVTE